MKKRIARLAKPQDAMPRVSVLEAVRATPDAEGSRAAFRAEAKHRLERMKRSGAGIPAQEVFAYLRKRAAGGRARPPKPRRIA